MNFQYLQNSKHQQTLQNNLGKTKEVQRLLNNTVLVGTVIDIDHKTAMSTVNVLPEGVAEDLQAINIQAYWIQRRAGWDSEWWAPEVNEQVVLLCPEGDLNFAIIIGSLPYKSNKAGENRDTKIEFTTPQELRGFIKDDELWSKHYLSYADGTSVLYDKEKHRYEIRVAASDKPDDTTANKRKTTAIAVSVDARTGAVNIKSTKKMQWLTGLKEITEKDQQPDATVQLAMDGETGLFDIQCKEQFKLTVNEDKAVLSIDKGGNAELKNQGNLQAQCEGSANIVAKGDVQIQSQGSASVKTQGDLTLESKGNIDLKASKITLNGGKKLVVSSSGVDAS